MVHELFVKYCGLTLDEAKKKKKSMSQSLWQIGRPDLNAFFFLFVFLTLFFLSSTNVKLDLVTTLFSMKYGTRYLDEQDTRQTIKELKKCVVQSVLLCLSCLLTGNFIKIGQKIKLAKTIKSLNFDESNAHRKTNARNRFETYNWFFSLIYKKQNKTKQKQTKTKTNKQTNKNNNKNKQKQNKHKNTHNSKSYD